MEVTGQLHASAALILGIVPKVPVIYEESWPHSRRGTAEKRIPLSRVRRL
jgi:hypothetical protein